MQADRVLRAHALALLSCACACACASGPQQAALAKPYGQLADLPSFPAAQYAKVWIVTDVDPTHLAVRDALGVQLRTEGVDVGVLTTQQLHEAQAAGRQIPPDVVLLVASAKLRSSRMDRADQRTERRTCRSHFLILFAIGPVVGTLVAVDNAYSCPRVITDRYALFETQGALALSLRSASGETLAVKELRSVARDRRNYPSEQVLWGLLEQARAAIRGYHQRYQVTLHPLEDVDARAGHRAALAGDWFAAARHYERALRKPEVAQNRKRAAIAHLNLAQALSFQRAGRLEPALLQALEHARAAAQLDPSARTATRWIAERLQRLQYATARRKEEAAKLLASRAPAAPAAAAPASTTPPGR